MSLKNANLGKDITGTAKLIKGLGDNTDDIANLISGRKIADIGQILSIAKISDSKDIEQILTKAGMAGKIDEVTDSMSSFSASQKGVNGLTTAFKNLGSAIMGIITSPITWTFVALGTAIFAAHKYLNRFNDALERSGESLSTYQDSKNDLENLKTEAENVRGSLEELGGKYDIKFSGSETVEDMIGKIEGIDTITLTDQNDLETLKQQNAELERQIQLQEKVVEKDKKEAQKDANKVLNMQTTSDLTQRNSKENSVAQGILLSNGATVAAESGSYEQTDIRTATKNEIAYLEQLYADKIQLNEEYQNAISETEKELIQGRIQNTENEIEKYTDEITKNIESLESVKEAFNDGTVEGQAVYDDINAIIDSFNNADLSPLERDLKKLDGVFNTKTGKVIKKSLMEASDSTLDLSEAMGRLGLSMEDLGVDSIETLQRYLQEAKGSVDELKDSMHELTVADVEKAFESPNQGANWDTMATRFKEAKELYKNGLIGTDDFQTFTQWLLPRDIKIPESFGDEEFKKYWENKSKKASKWFNAENPVKGMWDFLGNLNTSAPELFDTFNKSKGLVKFTEQFNNSAQAAAALGYNVDVIDTMLHKLEEYGFNFSEDFMFSGEAVNEFNNALSGMKNIYDSMADGKLKDALGEDILNWEEQYAALDGDLSQLTNEHVIDIKFNYDMALLDQQISEFDDKWLNGNKTSEVGAARIASRNQKLSELEKHNEYDVGNDVGYAGSYNNISSLQGKFAFAETSDDIAAIQEQIIAVQDMQLSFQETLASGKVIDWENFLQTDEAKSQMKSLVENGTLTVEELAEAFDISETELEMTLTATDDVTPVIDNINKQELFDKYVSLYGEDEATGIINLWNILEADEKFTQLSAEDQASVVIEYWDSLEPEQKTGIITSQITAEDGASEIIANVDLLMAALDASEPTADLKANDYVTPAVATAKYALDSLNGKIAHTYLYTHKETIEGSNASGTVHAKGTAFAQGTAHINGNVPNDALTNPKYRTSKPEDALTGELGPELSVDPKTGTYEVLGANGAEFRHIPAGRIIFNHKQTKELLSKGYTLSRGKANVTGTAFSNGGFLPTAANGYKYTGTGTSNNNANNNANNNNNGASDSAKEVIDKIEILISRMERSFSQLTDSIERYSHNLAQQNEVTDTAIKTAQNNLITLQQSSARYLQEANNVSLSDAWKQDIRNGAIDITRINDEDLKEKISEYQEWYEKHLDVEDKILETQQELLDLAVQKLENIDTYFQNRFGYNDDFGYATAISEFKTVVDQLRTELQAQVDNGIITEFSNEWYEAMATIAEREQDLFNAMWKKYEDVINYLSRVGDTLNDSLKLKEAQGELLTESDYQSQIENNNKLIQEYYDSILAYEKRIAVLDVGTSEYDELADKIADAKSEIFDLAISNEELEDSIWDVRFTTPFDELISGIDDTIESTDNLRALLNDEAFFDKQGVITEDGLSAISLLNQSLNESKQKVAEYTEGLRLLEDAYKNGAISEQKYKEEQSEMIKGIQDSVADVKSYKDELLDLYKQQMEHEADYLNDIIDKYAEAKDKKAAYYDYDKQIKNQTKTINSLKAEIAALEGVNNASAQAELKRKRAELAELEEELADTKREHSLDMQQQGYDAFKDDIATALEDTEYAIVHSTEKQEEVISSMLDRMVNKYAEAYGKINQIIYDTGFVGNSSSTQNIINSGTVTGSQSQADKGAIHQTQVDATISANTGSVNANSNNGAIVDHISQEQDIHNRKVAELTLSKTSVALEEGKSTTVTASVRPTDAKNKTLSWGSSNVSVATVSGGTIKALKPGTCQIVVSTTDGSGISQTIGVTVTKKPAPVQSTPSSGSSGGDGKARVGDVVTLNAGQRYYYDSYGQSPAGNLYAGVPGGVIIDGYSSTQYGGSTKSHGDYAIHIKSADGKYNDLGWVKLSQLSGYASGAKNISRSQWAIVNEKGEEIIINPQDGIQTSNGILKHIKGGSTIIDHKGAQNLYELAKYNPADIIGKSLSSVQGVNGNTTIENHYDSLLTVNGNVDKDALPGLQELLEKSYRYSIDKMYKEANKLGFRRTR